jgi:hypothetical protein
MDVRNIISFANIKNNYWTRLMKYETYFLLNYVTRFPENQTESEIRIVRLIGIRFLGSSAWFNTPPNCYILISYYKYWLNKLFTSFHKYIRSRNIPEPDIAICIKELVAYSPPVYRVRNLLAGLDHNNHINRPTLTKDDGTPRLLFRDRS